MNATILLRMQQTNSNSVVTFESVFPGHYSVRTTHHHLIVYLNSAIIQSNNTFKGGTYAHVGQLFWDQDLITAVETTYHYNTSNINITRNVVNHVLIAETEDTTSDPVYEYVYLGESLEDGLFRWITIVVNTSASYDQSCSFGLTDKGDWRSRGGVGVMLLG